MTDETTGLDGTGVAPEPEFDPALHCCGHRFPDLARLGACAGAVEHAGPHTYWTAYNLDGGKGVVDLWQPDTGTVSRVLHADFDGDVEDEGYAMAAALVAVRYAALRAEPATSPVAEAVPYPAHCICPCGRGTNPGCQVCP